MEKTNLFTITEALTRPLVIRKKYKLIYHKSIHELNHQNIWNSNAIFRYNTAY